MNVITVPRGIATLGYSTARLPLTLLERGVVARFLPGDAPVRLGYERALGLLDAVAAGC